MAILGHVDVLNARLEVVKHELDTWFSRLDTEADPLSFGNLKALYESLLPALAASSAEGSSPASEPRFVPVGEHRRRRRSDSPTAFDALLQRYEGTRSPEGLPLWAPAWAIEASACHTPLRAPRRLCIFVQLCATLCNFCVHDLAHLAQTAHIPAPRSAGGALPQSALVYSDAVLSGGGHGCLSARVESVRAALSAWTDLHYAGGAAPPDPADRSLSWAAGLDA